jgi:hypothetical protein
MDNLLKIKIRYCLSVFLLGLFVYGGFVFWHKGSDIRAHVIILIKEGYPSNFLYYLSLDLVTFFKRDLNELLAAAVMLLSATLVFKYTMTLKFLSLFDLNKEITTRQQNLKITFFALLLFAVPSAQFLAWGKYYSGQITPNVWHNSTVMYLMPVAIYNIYQIFSIVNENSSKTSNYWWLSAVMLISIFIKPSYFFIVAPTLSFFVLFGNLNKKFLISVVIGAIAVVVQYILIYRYNSNYVLQDKSGIDISFLESWKTQLRNYWFMVVPAFFGSLLFPIYHIFLNYGRLKKSFHFKFLVLMFLIAFVIFLFVIETGPRRAHGNFGWQMVVANYFLFIYLVKDWYNNRDFVLSKYKTLITKILFNLHLMAGVVYVIRVALFGLQK